MDLGLAFSFPFEDDEWVQKILIGAVISIIPLLGWIVLLGWSLEAARRVIHDDPQPLPDWSDFGGYAVLGIKGFLIGLVLSIPLLLLSIPMGVLSAAGQDYEEIVAFVSLCFSCFSLIYGILMAFAIPASYGLLAATYKLGEALNPSKIFGLLRAAPSAYLITLLGMLVAGFVGGLGVILCVIGVFATYAYAAVVQGHLFGQAYKQATTSEVQI